MSEEIIKTNTTTNSPAVASPVTAVSATAPKAAANDFRNKNPRRTSFRNARPKAEFEQKMLNIRRVARVATGGRRFSFSVAMVAGDKKGKVGVGLGKANDTSLAIDKALRDAKKNMIVVNLNKKSSIIHEVEAKYCSARISIKPAPGRGVVAGSAVRNVLELAGIKDVTAKILSGSKNKLNIARATVNALALLPKIQAKEVKADTKIAVDSVIAKK